MISILSYGGGINSTAIIALALLGKIKMPDYIIFSDTGAEYPYTYKYLDYIESKGIGLVYLTGGDKFESLTEFCLRKKIMPSRLNRWCTDHWKVTPIQRFVKSFDEKTEVLIGIDAGESHRARKKQQKGIVFPLIDFNINRNKCKKIIREAGLGVPQKSGCFFCPYQRVRQWIELKRDYPELWKIAVKIENQSRNRIPGYSFLGNGISLNDYIQDRDKQIDLEFGFALDQKCECYFD